MPLQCTITTMPNIPFPNQDAPLANHSDPNITGCRGITNCSHAKAHAFAKIDGIRGSKSHTDPDVLALLQSGPAAVSVDASAYNV